MPSMLEPPSYLFLGLWTGEMREMLFPDFDELLSGCGVNRSHFLAGFWGAWQGRVLIWALCFVTGENNATLLVLSCTL